MFNIKSEIKVYLKDGADSSLIQQFQKELSENKNVKEVKYISKDEEKERYLEKFKNNNQLKESLQEGEENPLPASLEVKTYDSNKIETLLPIIEKDQYKTIVRKVSY
ncbi:MAG: permease-like cell division protein FtsX [Patescibacteria group bacterium]